MKNFILLFAILQMISCKSGIDQPTTTMNNPFFVSYETPFNVPPFDLIKEEHFKPAIEKGIEEQKAEFDKIASYPEEPNFENTIVMLDKSGELLTKVTAVFFNLANAHTNDKIEAISEETAPLLSKHNDYLYLNAALFARVKNLYDKRDQLNLNEEQNKLLEKYYKAFIRNGALLSADDKEKISNINEELSLLTIKFGQNILAEVNDFKLVVDNIEELKGLPEGLIYEAAEKAKKEKQDGKWIFTLHNPSVMPFLQYAENRELREKIWTAMSNKGNNENKNNNNEIIKNIVSLRTQKSKMLGYASHAHYVLEEQMSKSPENVYKLLSDLWKPALSVAKKEADEMQSIIKAEGKDFDLKAHDWRYYAEKLRKQKYDLEEQELKPYFSLENTRDGVFKVCTNLFGLEFKERKDLPKYHEDVVVYEVLEKDGTAAGILYMDFFPRESKRGGAWMTSFSEQSIEDGKRVPPVISIVCNFSKPTPETPALLTFDEVTTFFHEFGHALHGLLSDVNYTSLSGTNVPTDFVELPSQIMENWAAEPEVMKMFAKHYKTGEIIPDNLIEKLKNSGTYGQGFATVEYLAASVLDMDFHTQTEIQEGSVASFEDESMQKLGLIDEIIPRYKSTYFNHIFAGGYSAGYYSYIWSEVLDSDAFEAFKEKGLFDAATANSFRKNILERGGSADPMDLYKRFRGKEPIIQPLLKKRGLLNVKS